MDIFQLKMCHICSTGRQVSLLFSEKTQELLIENPDQESPAYGQINKNKDKIFVLCEGIKAKKKVDESTCHWVS